MSAAKDGFFRQSAWLAAATVLGGALMTAVHPVASQMGDTEYGVLGAMLRQVKSRQSTPTQLTRHTTVMFTWVGTAA